MQSRPKTHQKIELKAQRRATLGRAVRRVRAYGFVPAVLYGKGQESVTLQVPTRDFERTFKQAGESTLVYLMVAGLSEGAEAAGIPTIIHDVARDPMSDEVIHADFYKVRLDEKIKTKVPVVFTGQAPAVTELKGVFVRSVNELEVEALPQDLPHEISVDISTLKNFNDHLTVKDLALGSKVAILTDENEILATVQEPISEEKLKEMLEAPTTDVSAVELEKKEKEEAAEGEEGAAAEAGEDAKAPAGEGEAPTKDK